MTSDAQNSDQQSGGNSAEIPRYHRTFHPDTWDLLMLKIERKQCIPFLGAGASYPSIPLGGQLAQEWASEKKYPLDDKTDLTRVSQFLAVKDTEAWGIKTRLSRRIDKTPLPNFEELDEPHGVLARMPIPLYMTTNYDSFMVKALEARNKEPRQTFCRWNKNLRSREGSLDETSEFSSDRPLVYHWHGLTRLPDSLVLTEDDYVDFLVNIAENRGLIPNRIQGAMSECSLLFLGYSLGDWNFRVLFRSIVSYVEISSAKAQFSVQLVPLKKEATEQERETAAAYLDQYFNQKNVSVYWGTCNQFAAELKNHWENWS